ncbi:MAG: tRNA pseudouridine(38-40) synthase TruA [Bdellovibrionota bacterium]
MPRLKLYFSYVGTRYHGWQRQKNTRYTIQEILETKFSVIANKRVSVVASGRTDAGVHARIQVAHVDVPDSVVRLYERNRLILGLNSLLPRDIRVLKVEPAVDDFHAIRDAKKKTYLYFLDTNPIQWPELRHSAWHLRLPIDWKAIEEGTRYFKGKHDFKAFCGANGNAKTSVREIYEAHWGAVRWRGVGGVCELRVLRVTGNGFLRNMVRSIVGTLVHVGSGKSSPEKIRTALETCDRKLAGPTAPAHGLWLWDILYLT